jgi:hypothetical protein
MENPLHSPEERIRSLEERVKAFYLVFVVMSIAMIAMVFATISRTRGELADTTDKVIRARGVIIVDDRGRERILLGAPIPQAANRVRTNPDRVKQAWASGFPPEYLEWYKSYRHSMDGMLVLDEEGFDRVAVGDQLLDANVGRRVSSNMTGILVNEERGVERGGYGVLKVNDKNRVILTMDARDGTEGLALSLHDDAGLGLEIREQQQSIFLGNAPSNSWRTGLPEPFHGLLIKEGNSIRQKIGAGGRD